MTDFDRIITSAPVNATAARQLAKGEAHKPAVKIQDYWPDMPPIKACKDMPHHDPGFTDHSGKVFGRLTVIGLLAGKNKNAPATWVCRCQCGGFCGRTARSLKVAAMGGNSFVDRCGLCSYTDKLRSGWSPSKTPLHKLASAGRVVIQPKGK